jgi:hypothetical protein
VLLEFIGRHLIKCVATYRLTLPSKPSVCHLLQFLQPHSTTAPRVLVTRSVAGAARRCCTAARAQLAATYQDQHTDQPHRSQLLPLLNRRRQEQLMLKNVCLCSATERTLCGPDQGAVYCSTYSAVLQSAHCVVLTKALSTVAHRQHSTYRFIYVYVPRNTVFMVWPRACL